MNSISVLPEFKKLRRRVRYDNRPISIIQYTKQLLDDIALTDYDKQALFIFDDLDLLITSYASSVDIWIHWITEYKELKEAVSKLEIDSRTRQEVKQEMNTILSQYSTTQLPENFLEGEPKYIMTKLKERKVILVLIPIILITILIIKYLY